ncbi:MAG: hypothetical protein ASARMPRED_005422 [Alectoria sarmentosa]|nr:MAG: hypothetical protein ASARMPRED_005422 [Alectoria sarmentosa]
MEDVYSWAVSSLGNSSSTLNDYVSPIGVLVSVVASLLLNSPSDSPFAPPPNLPKFLESGNSSIAPPWSNRNTGDSGPQGVANTGVTRYYDFVVARGVIAPDGVNKSSILVNNQYPGPLIEANWGDYLEVTVHNNIFGPSEGTSMHWHGLPQNGTPWLACTERRGITLICRPNTLRGSMDVGLTPYRSKLTKSKKVLAMVIYGPASSAYDFDIGPILISDYYHADYYKLVENVVGNNTLTSLLAPSDNTLIHGLTNYACSLTSSDPPCTAGPALGKFKFSTGKTHRLRLINPSSSGSPIIFSIDNHTMTVIANDFVPVAGQRSDVLVTATGKPGDLYWIRARQPDFCNFVLQPFGLAAIYYDGADRNQIPASTPPQNFLTPVLNNCDPLESTVPSYQITPDSSPDATLVLNMSLTVNSTGHTLYQMNAQSFRGDFNDPLLSVFSAKTPSSPLDSERNVYNFARNESIRIIMNNNISFGHPMHLHGQQMFVLAVGTGTWDGKVVNPENPQRRDTQLVPAYGYLVIQLTGNNPGVWPLHCHISWHLSAGMLVNLVLQPDELERMKVPEALEQTCKDWNAYTAGNAVDQIDSGS